jgi:DNA-binding NarL/FixJ family response regulator
LPDHVRAAVLADIELTHERAVTAEEDDKVRIFLATEQGLDTYEIADQLGISQTTVSKYARQGKEILERREREKREREPARDQPAGRDPDRSGEPEPVS